MIFRNQSAHSSKTGSNDSARAATRLARYGFAVASALAAIVVELLLQQHDDSPFYALLVAAVVLSLWFGGLGPSVVAVVLGWGLSFVFFVGETDAFDRGGELEYFRWSVSLVIAFGIVWVDAVLRHARDRATKEVGIAEDSIRGLEALGELASAVSGAVTTSEVAHALIAHTPGVIGAAGGAVGLVEDGELVIVDPVGVPAQTHPPGTRMALGANAAITRAAAEGTWQLAADRATFVEDFPDGAALFPASAAVLAVPLRVAGEVVGSMGFLFDQPMAATSDLRDLALLAADLGGQALERAQLYERERASRQALDRILRIAPELHAHSPDEVSKAICREARMTFGADLATLWRVSDDQLELVRSDPVVEPLVPGLKASLDDFHGLMDAVGNLQISFVSDIQGEARGAGLERVRRLGVRSSLRTPIAVGGHVEHVLIVSWETVITQPDPLATVLARRFADQAGLALEEVERRGAEASARRRAAETLRLQEITAALSLAASATDVSNVCLESALSAVGAEAGFVVLSRPGQVLVELVASSGYDDDQLETWRAYDLDSNVPFSRAIATGEPVWALTAEAMAEFVGAPDLGEAGWVTLPLRTSAGTRGALQLSFRQPRALSERERRWLETVVSQCAQALERSRLFDEEQRLRTRSEQLQNMTAELANTLTRADVASVVLEQIGEALGTAGIAIAEVDEDRQFLNVMASRGYSDDVVEQWRDTPLDMPTPGNHAVRERALLFFESIASLQDGYPEVVEGLAATGHASFLFLPLVAGRRAHGLLVASWAESNALSSDERRFVQILAGLTSDALERTRYFESERTIAETLQRSVLPTSLPRVPGVQMAARYLPGTAGLEVGGDWFDAIQLSGGKLGLVVGDVVGKGVQAAATMSQLRNALRAFSLDRLKPSSTITRLNRLSEEMLDSAFATILYVVVDPETGTCRFTSAGHPPPVVVYPDGRAELLEGGRGLPLGAAADARYGQGMVQLPIGGVLVLYTDGLVERRERPIDEGFELLRATAATGPRDPDHLLEHLVERLVGTNERDDDVALLAVRLLAVAPRPFELSVPSEEGSLDLVRGALRFWLDGTSLNRVDAHNVVLATWEACANAIEHAREPESDRICVRAEVTSSTVRVHVEDTGRWAPPADRVDRGLGLRLMHSLMSSVEITPSDRGTLVTFERMLPEPASEAVRRSG